MSQSLTVLDEQVAAAQMANEAWKDHGTKLEQQLSIVLEENETLKENVVLAEKANSAWSDHASAMGEAAAVERAGFEAQVSELRSALEAATSTGAEQVEQAKRASATEESFKAELQQAQERMLGLEQEKGSLGVEVEGLKREAAQLQVTKAQDVQQAEVDGPKEIHRPRVSHQDRYTRSYRAPNEVRIS